MEVSCRHFNGYKPCGKSVVCDHSCKQLDRLKGAVILIHLGAMGAVLRSTALLERIHEKYPRHQLIWITDAPMHRLLEGHPRIDRVLPATEEALQEIRGRHFEAAFVIDKSARASGILSQVTSKSVYGFVRDENLGVILPATEAAEELWQLGLSNELKFFVNTKTETQLVAEALELSHRNEKFNADYDFQLKTTERAEVDRRREIYRQQTNQPLIGFNTGCGPLMPAKKWTVSFHREVIQDLLAQGFKNIVLLGGPDDLKRNQEIASGLPVQLSPTDLGVRDGAISVAACDVVFSGDSFGLHLAIALQKFVIAWFGPSCAHEIDLYGRGIKLFSEVGCSPCWKRTCDKPVMCHDRVPLEQVREAFLKAVAIISQPVLESARDRGQGGTTDLSDSNGISGRPATSGDASP